MIGSRIGLLSLVAIAGAVSAAPAGAQSGPGTAAATLSDFQITGTDLRPDDGVAAQWSMISNADLPPPPPPQYWFRLPDSYRGANVQRGTDDRRSFERDVTYMPVVDMIESAPWGQGAVFSDGSNVTASAALSESEASAHGSYVSIGMFLVGPHTSVTFSGTFASQAQCASGCRTADAFAHLNLRSYPLGSFEYGASAQFGEDYYGTQVYLTRPGSDASSVPVEVTFANDTDSQAQVSAEVFLYAQMDAVTPVPEPAGAASLLAGLALLGGAARRKRRLATVTR